MRPFTAMAVVGVCAISLAAMYLQSPAFGWFLLVVVCMLVAADKRE